MTISSEAENVLAPYTKNEKTVMRLLLAALPDSDALVHHENRERP